MSGTSSDGNPPPEVPEQFADAYRRAYADALGSWQEPEPIEVGDEVETEPARAPAPPALAPTSPAMAMATAPPPTGPPAAPRGAHRAETPARAATPAAISASFRDSPYFVPVALVVAALLLVAAAYMLGRLISDGGDEVPVSREQLSSGSTNPAPKVRAAAGAKYQGRIVAVDAAGAEAECTSADGVDSAGDRVGYDALNMIDGQTETAWRCDGSAVGQVLTFQLPRALGIGELGLIPGYAKTDSSSGDDRYAENNRITKVRWIFADGASVEQEMKPDPKDRSMRTIRVPATETKTVRLQILAVESGSRNTTAISEVRIGAVS